MKKCTKKALGSIIELTKDADLDKVSSTFMTVERTVRVRIDLICNFAFLSDTKCLGSYERNEEKNEVRF